VAAAFSHAATCCAASQRCVTALGKLPPAFMPSGRQAQSAGCVSGPMIATIRPQLQVLRNKSGLRQCHIMTGPLRLSVPESAWHPPGTRRAAQTIRQRVS
jgi:hypothetical protein